MKKYQLHWPWKTRWYLLLHIVPLHLHHNIMDLHMGRVQTVHAATCRWPLRLSCPDTSDVRWHRSGHHQAHQFLALKNREKTDPDAKAEQKKRFELDEKLRFNPSAGGPTVCRLRNTQVSVPPGCFAFTQCRSYSSTLVVVSWSSFFQIDTNPILRNCTVCVFSTSDFRSGKSEVVLWGLALIVGL